MMDVIILKDQGKWDITTAEYMYMYTVNVQKYIFHQYQIAHNYK